MQQDYLMRLLEQFSKVLAKIIGLKEKRNNNKAIEIINEAYASLLKTDNLEINKSVTRELIEKFNDEQLNIIGDLLFEEGEICLIEGRISDGQLKLKKALELYQYLDEKQRTFSLDRENKIQKIKIFLGK